MPDGVSSTSPVRRIAVVLAVFVIGGALAGVVWERLWSAPVGLTFRGEWFLEPAGPDLSFEGTALYVMIALPLGILLAILCTLRPHHEVTTVVAVLVAAGLGAVTMYAVGHGLGPSDPQALAAGRPDFTALPAELVLGSSTAGERPFSSTALMAMPVGAMAGLVGVYLLGRRRVDTASRG